MNPPRRIIVSAACHAEEPLRHRDPAASDTETPAMKRKSGAAKPPATMQYQKRSPALSSGCVHESSVCHAIMMTTARPRTQSR